LANDQAVSTEPRDNDWAELREAQAMTEKTFRPFRFAPMTGARKVMNKRMNNEERRTISFESCGFCEISPLSGLVFQPPG